MTRPVEGYLSFDGKFFDTERDCKLHETSLDLVGILFNSGAVSGFSAEDQKVLVTEFLRTMRENLNTFYNYVSIRKDMQDEEPTTGPVVEPDHEQPLPGEDERPNVEDGAFTEPEDIIDPGG